MAIPQGEEFNFAIYDLPAADNDLVPWPLDESVPPPEGQSFFWQRTAAAFEAWADIGTDLQLLHWLRYCTGYAMVCMLTRPTGQNAGMAATPSCPLTRPPTGNQ